MGLNDFVLLVLAVIGLVLSVLDVISTEGAFRKGAREANPIMAWLQRKFPAWWPYIRVGAALVVIVVASLVLPWPVSISVLLMMDVLYAIVVKRNFDIAAGK